MMKYLFFVLMIVGMAACIGTKKHNVDLSSFTPEQSRLIHDGDTITPMRVFLITKPSDSILLRTPSQYITPNQNDSTLTHLVKRLYVTVRDSLTMGVGIAAPQVGILKSVIWVQRFDKPEMPFEVYLNPMINSYSEEKFPCREGCLSIPNRRDTTQIRSREIELSYDKLSGEHVSAEKVEGFTSVIFQHEVDHLYGILYTDHLTEEVLESE